MTKTGLEVSDEDLLIGFDGRPQALSKISIPGHMNSIEGGNVFIKMRS